MPRPRVLVVNAELGTSHAIPATLTGDGYEVDLVDPADVLDRFANYHYDLLIADLWRPDLDGAALYRALRARWPSASTRLIFLSSADHRLLVTDDHRGPDTPILSAPLTLQSLRRTVRLVLGVL